MKPNRKIIFFSLLALLLLSGGLLAYVFVGLPNVDSLPQQLRQPSLRITDRNNRLLYEVLPPGSGVHAVVALERLPACMKQATIGIGRHEKMGMGMGMGMGMVPETGNHGHRHA